MLDVFATMLLGQKPANPPSDLTLVEQRQFSGYKLSQETSLESPPAADPSQAAPLDPGMEPAVALTADSLLSQRDREIAQLPQPEVIPFPAPQPPAIELQPNPSRNSILVQEVRPLPGSLDQIPVFNSNSPEMVRTEGILLSTFPPQGKLNPNAHLNFPLQGRFDLFAHHITQTNTPDDVPTLYLGFLLFNPSNRTVYIDILQGASFLSTPDAPFRALPALVDNPTGYVFSGPGSRVTTQVLRGRRQPLWPSQIMIPPREARMLASLPIPLPKLRASSRPVRLQRPVLNVLGEIQPLPFLEELPPLRNLAPSSNGRSTLMHLQSSGPVYAASIAQYARFNPDGTERPPALEDWVSLLLNGQLASPRDIIPTPPQLYTHAGNRIFYGRVSGISQGSRWQSNLTDNPTATKLSIPRRGQAFAYGLSTLPQGTLGTGQIQSAPMLSRYPDTAFMAHGNYGVHYDLTLPLYNPTSQPQAISLAVQTPLKQDTFPGRLQFLNPPPRQVFFRGTVRVGFEDDLGMAQTRYVHLVQHRGQRGEPIAALTLQPGERRQVEVDFLYPPDATPPQVLTVSTLANPNALTTQRLPRSTPAGTPTSKPPLPSPPLPKASQAVVPQSSP